MDIQITDQRLFRHIAELDMVEFYIALHMVQIMGMVGIRCFLPLIQEGEDPVAGSRSRLHDGGKVRRLGDGLVELAHILDKGLDLAYGKPRAKGHQRTGYGDAHIPQVAEEIDQRHEQP